MKGLDKEGLDRREFLKRAGIAAAGLGLVACAPAAAPTATPTKSPAPTSAATAAPAAKAAATPTPSDADALAKLYEAAKKEGEVMVYTAGTSAEWEEMNAEFTKQFPGIKTTAYAATSEAIREKVLTEARARKVVGEVLMRGAFEDAYSYVKEGVLDSYLSPQAKYYDPKFYEPSGQFYYNNYLLMVPEYNTKAISKEQAPKSFADMLKPEYKGKLGLEANPIMWFTGMLSIMGKEKGLEYMKKLAEQKPRLISGHTSLHKLVVTGEIPIAVYMFHMRPVVDKAAGAPVEWVDPVEKTATMPTVTAVFKNAPHPNAARLMLDFYLGEGGAKSILKQGWMPNRKGVDLGVMAPLANVEALIPTDPALGQEVHANEAVFRQIFGAP